MGRWVCDSPGVGPEGPARLRQQGAVGEAAHGVPHGATRAELHHEVGHPALGQPEEACLRKKESKRTRAREREDAERERRTDETKENKRSLYK